MFDHLRALRPHQWIKNGFVFGPLIFARRLMDVEAVQDSLWAVVAFSAVASAIYLLNDVMDYDRDRQHPKKCLRPIAAGKVKKRTALVLAATLAPAGLAVAWTLGIATMTVIGMYLIMNLLYSTLLKHVVLVDVFVIAIGFLMRVVAGALAIQVGVSAWLLVCTLFVALLLAFGKRRGEAMELGADAAAHRGTLAEYGATFIDTAVASLAAMTVMSYALYTIDPAVMKRLGTDALVLTVPLVLFGVMRYLFVLHHRGLGASPTQLVLKDTGMKVVVALWLVTCIVAIYYQVQLGLIHGGPL